jgi:hypothetical protein
MASSNTNIELDAEELESFKSIMKKDPDIKDLAPFANDILNKRFGDKAPKNMFVGISSEKDKHVLYFVEASGGADKASLDYSLKLNFSCSF